VARVTVMCCLVSVQDDRNGREQVSVGVVEVSEVVAHELGPRLLWKERATTVCSRAQKASLTHLDYVMLKRHLQKT